MANNQISTSYETIIPMEKKTTYISKDVELKVSYEYEQMPSQIEECHGHHDVGRMMYVDVTDVKLMISDDGLSVLSIMTEEQIRKIINIIYEQHQNN